jgi:hypothetical protein
MGADGILAPSSSLAPDWPARPARVGPSNEPSLRDGLASPGPASAHQELGGCDEDGNQASGWSVLVQWPGRSR